MCSRRGASVRAASPDHPSDAAPALARLLRASVRDLVLEGAAGLADDAPVVLRPGDRAMIPTGFCIAVPAGFEAQARPRSGLAAKAGVTCLNSPGTIDSDYRGELKVILINHGAEAFTVRRGDRIAQLVIAPVVQAAWIEVTSLDETGRGAGGFGSTGAA